jgi:hypothetical protein
MEPVLFIVSRERKDLYEYLAAKLRPGDGVQVILDRRAEGDRRRQAERAVQPERRRSSDRRRDEVDGSLRGLGLAVARRRIS